MSPVCSFVCKCCLCLQCPILRRPISPGFLWTVFTLVAGMLFQPYFLLLVTLDGFCFFISDPPLILIQFPPSLAHVSTSDTALARALSSLFWGLDSACITDSASEKTTTLFCMAFLCSSNIIAAIFKS